MNNQTIRQTPVLRVAVYFSLLYQLDTETLRHKLYNSSIYLNMPVMTFWISRHYHRYMAQNDSTWLNSCIQNVKIMYWIRSIFLSLISSMITYWPSQNCCEFDTVIITVEGKITTSDWLTINTAFLLMTYGNVYWLQKNGNAYDMRNLHYVWFHIISHPE